MTNHHGYDDGYSLEFNSPGTAVGLTIDMVCAASSLHVARSSFGR
jgi:hypothetical protein